MRFRLIHWLVLVGIACSAAACSESEKVFGIGSEYRLRWSKAKQRTSNHMGGGMQTVTVTFFEWRADGSWHSRRIRLPNEDPVNGFVAHDDRTRFAVYGGKPARWTLLYWLPDIKTSALDPGHVVVVPTDQQTAELDWTATPSLSALAKRIESDGDIALGGPPRDKRGDELLSFDAQAVLEQAR